MPTLNWIGKVVGDEVEDLSRHDKGLCMMYPRLMLRKDFLRGDGGISSDSAGTTADSLINH